MMTDDDYLRDVIRSAVDELEHEHRPLWTSDAMEAAGAPPMGCLVCWPGDGRWPCVTRGVVSDLRRALADTGDGEDRAAYYDADPSHRDPVGPPRELPPELIARIEEARAHPERLVRRRPRNRPDE